MPGVAVPIVGAGGGPTGIASTDADGSLVPEEFVAVTVHEYVVPFVRLVTEIGLVVPVAVRVTPPVTEQLAVNPVIVAPPLPLAVKATETLPFPGVTVPIVGAAGTPTGVPLTEPDDGPTPSAFSALTEQAYAVPFVKPVTTIGLAVPVAVFAVPSVGAQLTVKAVIDEPFDDPAVNATESCPFPAVAVPIVGAAGAPAVVALRAFDDPLLPMALAATTEQL